MIITPLYFLYAHSSTSEQSFVEHKKKIGTNIENDRLKNYLKIRGETMRTRIERGFL